MFLPEVRRDGEQYPAEERLFAARARDHALTQCGAVFGIIDKFSSCESRLDGHVWPEEPSFNESETRGRVDRRGDGLGVSPI